MHHSTGILQCLYIGYLLFECSDDMSHLQQTLIGKIQVNHAVWHSLCEWEHWDRFINVFFIAQFGNSWVMGALWPCLMDLLWRQTQEKLKGFWKPSMDYSWLNSSCNYGCELRQLGMYFILAGEHSDKVQDPGKCCAFCRPTWTWSNIWVCKVCSSGCYGEQAWSRILALFETPRKRVPCTWTDWKPGHKLLRKQKALTTVLLGLYHFRMQGRGNDLFS